MYYKNNDKTLKFDKKKDIKNMNKVYNEEILEKCLPKNVRKN